MIFLIVYNTQTSRLLAVREFASDQRDAARDSLNEEQSRHLAELDHVEVALFESSSRAVLERTHSRYFMTMSELNAAARPHQQ